VDNFIIFDRDGTLIEFEHYLIQPNRVVINDYTFCGLQSLIENGYRLGVISNQSIIGRGIASKEQVELVNNEMLLQFKAQGINFDFILYCPHSPVDLCECRKPKISLGLKAIKEYNINVGGSYMIGDMESDIEFGVALRLTTVKISSQFSTTASFTAENVLDASNWILDNRWI
jgi:D-glycero-D-manno-heptose 1,7-bisphosphate phosphatase